MKMTVASPKSVSVHLYAVSLVLYCVMMHCNTDFVCMVLVVVVALLFYAHGKHLRSCRDGQLS